MDGEDFFERIGQDVEGRRQHARPSLEAVGLMAAKENHPVAASFAGTFATDAQRRWAANDALFWASSQTYDRLPPGLYRCEMAEHLGPVLRRSPIETDALVLLPDSAAAEVIAEIRTFWTLEAEFKARGFLWKRGVLLWGPAGSGKTSALHQLVSVVVNGHDGIALMIDHPKIAASCLQMVRKVEPERPIVALMEDMDALVETYGENEYLALLDGEAQVGNISFVATTNYPERLDRRFVDRPSRFDLVKFIDMPTAAARRAYLAAKEPSLVTDGVLDKWVQRSDGLSIAHLREMIILCRCYGKPLDEAVRRLEKMRGRKPTSGDFDERSSMGFGR